MTSSIAITPGPGNPFLRAALSYAALGWRVFPCKPQAKEPLGTLAPNGVHSASSDPEKVAAWWQNSPHANIGLACGRASGFFVVDVDGDEGLRALRDIEARHSALPDTIQSLTGSGGIHLFLAYPPGAEVDCPHLAADIHVKGDGGYVVAPPSVHPNGHSYVWEATGDPFDGVELAPCPEWLVAEIGKKGEGQGADPGILEGLDFSPSRRLDPEKLAAALHAGERLADHFQRRSCGGDPSACDLGLADLTQATGWPLQDTVDLVITARAAHGDRPRPMPKDRSFWQATLAKAADRASQDAVAPAPSERSKPAAAEVSSPLDWTTARQLGETTAELQWLWERWLPRGHLSILAGETGSGKSALALWLASCLTTGAPWPDGTEHDSRDVPVLIADTEGAQTVFIDRIRRWGVPMDNIFFPGIDGFGRLLLDDERMLRGVKLRIAESGVPLVIVDSLRTALGGSIDENDSRISSILAPWQDLARETGIGLLIVHHYGKRRQHEGTQASIERLRGSSAIGAAGRSILAIDHPDPESEYSRLQIVKSNLALQPDPLGFRIASDGIEFIPNAPSTPARATARNAACEYLRASLERGPILKTELFANKPNGVSDDSLYRARKTLNLVSVDDHTDPANRRKLWGLPVREDGRW